MKKAILILLIVVTGFICHSQNWKSYGWGKDVRAVTMGPTGKVYIATYGGGLVELDPSTGEKKFYNTANSGIPGNYINSVHWDTFNDCLWVGTPDGGLAKFDGINTWTTYNTNNSGLPSNHVNHITQYNGTVAVATNEGLALLNEQGNWSVINSSNGLSDNDVTCVGMGANNQWVAGTANGGLYHCADGTATPIANGISDRINSISIADDGMYIVGTLDAGFGVYDPEEEGWLQHFTTSNSNIPSNNVNNVAQKGPGSYLAGTDNGLYVTDEFGENDIFNTANSNIPGNNVQAVYVPGPGHSFIGTTNGLAKLDVMNEQWTGYDTNNSGLQNPGVNDINGETNKDFYRGGTVWFCNYDALLSYDGFDWVVYNSDNSGLPEAQLKKIAIDNTGNKWIATNSGLVKFDGANWVIFNTSNSQIPSDNLSSVVVDNSGNIWVGTFGEGVCMFDASTWTIYNTTNSELPNNAVLSFLGVLVIKMFTC